MEPTRMFKATSKEESKLLADKDRYYEQTSTRSYNQEVLSKEYLTENPGLPDLIEFDTRSQTEDRSYLSSALKSIKTVEPSNLKVQLLRESKFKYYVMAPILTIFTIGFAFLFAEWYSSVMLFLLYKKAKNEDDATHIIIEETREVIEGMNKEGQKEIVIKKEHDIVDIKTKIGTLLKFQYKYTPFFFNTRDGTVKKIEYNYERKFSNLRKLKAGISECDYEDLLSLYGPCKMELLVDPWYRILARDTLNAYYIYQIMGLTVWYISGYYKYATLIVILMVYSIYTEYYDLQESMGKLKQIARYE